MTKTTMMMIAGLAMSLATGCSSLGGSTSPDEFRVVKKAPLVIPPEYSLRPPQAGQAQPFEVDESRIGTVSAFGTDLGQNASPAERALVAAAGANAVSPIIRQQVDWEQAKTIRKTSSVSDRVLDWEGSEDDSDDSATGGGDVMIERGGGERLKLPGT
ncbi:MAG: DUF3035 domain-containing protein [Pseudomonadota bacterium]